MGLGFLCLEMITLFSWTARFIHGNNCLPEANYLDFDFVLLLFESYKFEDHIVVNLELVKLVKLCVN